MAALAELGAWAVALVCLGIALVITILLVALFEWLINILNNVPFVNIGTGWLHTTEQTVTNALGVAFSKVNHIMGASLHLFARYADDLWQEIVGHASLLLDIASYLPIIGNVVNDLRALVHHSVHTNTATSARVKTLEREYHGIEHEIKVLQRDYAHGIGDDVLPRLKRLEKEATRIRTKTIPAIQAQDTTFEGELTNLYDWVKGKASLVGVGTFAFAIAAVIGRDVFKLLRCNELGNLARKYRCGLWNLLGNLLALAGFLTIAFDFEEFVKASDEVAGFIGHAVASIEGTFETSLPPLPPPN